MPSGETSWNLAGATRVERALSAGGRGFGVRRIAIYATPLRLVHAAGLEPAVSHVVILIYSQVPSPLGPRMRNLL
jgi:hypothetical protein